MASAPSFTVPRRTPAAATRRRRKEARPSELIDAALDLFVEKGYAQTRLEEVAARAGVAKSTIYLYYASKEVLLQAVIRHHLGEALAAGAAEVDAHTGPTADVVTGAFVRWWQRILAGPASGVFKLMITEMRNFPEIAAFYAREVVEPGERIIRRIVERGIERREFRAVDVASAVHSLMLPMVMLCLHKHTLAPCLAAAGFDAHGFIEQHMRLVLAGLTLPPTP